MSKEQLLIIIPVLNEEKNIGKVIDNLRAVAGDILVINDASTDKTLSILEEKNVKHIDLITRLQYGATIQTGFRYALANDYKFAALIDGDGQHDSSHLIEMLEIIKSGKADLVIGTRKGSEYKMPLFRKIGSRLFSIIIKMITHEDISDPTSGYQVFNKKILEMYCDDNFPHDYPDADVIISLILNGLMVTEHPVKMYPSTEKSMHTFWNAFYYIYKMSISIIMTVLRSGGIKR